MTVRTKQLALGTFNDGPALVTVYTVPVGRTALIKEISVVRQGVVGFSVGMHVRRTGVLVAVLHYVASVAPDVVTTLANRFVVLKPGDELVLQVNRSSGATDVVKYIVSGVELDGLAP